MSFNKNYYNLTPFNRTGLDNVTWTSCDGYERVDAFLGVSQQIFLFCMPHEKVLKNILGTACKAFKNKDNEYIEGHEYVGWNVGLEGVIWRDYEIREQLYTKAVLSLETYIEASASEILSNELSVFHYFHTKLDGSEQISNNTTWYAQHFIYPDEINELISQVADVIFLDEKSCTLNLTLLPGEKVVIDSTNYNVYYNRFTGIDVAISGTWINPLKYFRSTKTGKTYPLTEDGKNELLKDLAKIVSSQSNAIHTHSGGWFDDLDRDVLSIKITAGSGESGLTGNIIYTERYL